MNKRHIYIIPVIISILFYSCNKDEGSKPVSSFRGQLQSIELTSYGEVTNKLTYDGNDLKHIKQDYIVNNDESSRIKNEYDFDRETVNGRSIITISSPNPDFDGIKYYMNSNNKLDSLTRNAYVPGSFEGRLRKEYMYNSSGRLFKMFKILYAPGLPNDTTIYHFVQDANGNILEQRYIYITTEKGKVVEREIRLEYEYDDKVNPFRDFYGAEYFFAFFQEIISFNNNNVIGIKHYSDGVFGGENSSFTYKYNEQSSPVNIDVNSNGYYYKLTYRK